MTFTLIMMSLRNINYNNEDIFEHLNSRTLLGNELYGKTLGIIGYGRVGKILSKYTHSFGAKNLHYDLVKSNSKYSSYSTLNNLLKKSDIVSINVNLDIRNKYYFNKDFFKKMKRGAILINTSRGEIIDEKDLIEALEKNIIYKAALDVLCNENRGFDFIFKKFKKLINLNKLIITPHISGTTIESLTKTSDFIMQQISKYLIKSHKKTRIKLIKFIIYLLKVVLNKSKIYDFIIKKLNLTILQILDFKLRILLIKYQITNKKIDANKYKFLDIKKEKNEDYIKLAATIINLKDKNFYKNISFDLENLDSFYRLSWIIRDLKDNNFEYFNYNLNEVLNNLEIKYKHLFYHSYTISERLEKRYIFLLINKYQFIK